MAVCTVTSYSQQALWGLQILSPEIHEDNTVTFRIRAPKAVKVEVTGDFIAPQLIDTPSESLKVRVSQS